MTKDTFMQYLTQVQPNNITDNCINVVSYYLNEKVKQVDRNTLIRMAHANPSRFLYGRNNIIERLKTDFNIIEVFKDNKLIAMK